MEILSYNIMSGGFNDYDSLSKTPERLDLLMKTIKNINADFVSLVDTHRWTEIFSEDDLKNIFGYENVYSVKLEDERLKVIGRDNGVTVLTRLPVEKFEAVRLFNRNAIKTTVNGIDVFTTYLDDLNEDTRLQQIDSLLSQVTLGVPTIITGDLNTIDELDLLEADGKIKELFIQHPEARPLEITLKGMLRGEVTRKIRENGFVDMGKGKGNTFPTKLFPIQIGKPMARFDYGFCTLNIKVENFEVLKGVEFDQLSDHFPIKMRVRLG